MTPDSSPSPLASGVRSLLIGSAALGAIVALSVAASTLLRVRLFPVGTHPVASAAASRPGLGLRAEVRGGGLQVSWNREAAPVRNATSGSLTFQDGEVRKTLQLNQTTARAGTVFYSARGTQVQVALTIFAPDHVVSESISAAVPAAAAQPASPPASVTGSEVLVPSQDAKASVANSGAEDPTRASRTNAAARRLGRRKSDHTLPPVRDPGAAGSAAQPVSPREEPAAADTAVPETAVPDSRPGLTPATVAIRVEVDETGKVLEAVLIPQKDLDPAFAEAALEMARDWRFEASPLGEQRTTHVLEFRQAANR
jgi:TonB family protein